MVNQTYQEDTTLLMYAAQNGQTAAVKALIAAGANVNAKNVYTNRTPLMLAITGKHKSTVLALLDGGADPNINSGIGDNTLTQAAINFDDPDLVHLLIRSGVPIDDVERKGNFTPLMGAAANDGIQTAKILLEAHAQVNAQDVRGETALCWAARTGYARMLTLLLHAGADPSIKDRRGRTSLDWAIQEDHQAAIKVLRGSPSPAPKATPAPNQ